MAGRNQDKTSEQRPALCLSGGGYRAMLFHAGAILRLSELGLLKTSPGLDGIASVSSVSGGSMTAAAASLNWNELSAGQTTGFVAAIQRLVNHTLIDPELLAKALLEGGVNKHITQRLDDLGLKDASLQSLPEHPNFIINATNMLTTVRWEFTRGHMGDYRTGYIANPELALSQAVSASAAYPPYLSPAHLNLKPSDFTPDTGTDCTSDGYRTAVKLTDGGIYDNLGLEAVWKDHQQLIVSDASAPTATETTLDDDWLHQSLRVIDIVDRQVSSLRKRMLMSRVEDGTLSAAYWNIADDIKNYPADNTLPCPIEQTTILAHMETDLEKKSAMQQQRLMNWGYALSDAAVRSYVLKEAAAPSEFPYPEAGVGSSDN